MEKSDGNNPQISHQTDVIKNRSQLNYLVSQQTNKQTKTRNLDYCHRKPIHIEVFYCAPRTK